MISAILICNYCGYYAGIIPGTTQETIIPAVLPAFFVNTEPTNKTFQNSFGTDRYTLIERSGDYTVITNCKWS